jgi:hypothetical protein
MAVRQSLILATAVAGGICSSQMPEFAQQYHQRIGGAIEELKHVVDDFDRDASNNGMDREQALQMHERASEPLFRDRGRSMRTTVARLDTLVRQRTEFDTYSPLVRPFVLAGSDPATFDGTWRDFRPAVPTTPDGLAWGAAGFFCAASLLFLVIYFIAWRWRLAFAGRRSSVSQGRP